MKETFYFPHDYNARTDDKVKRLIRKHGMSGYGIFWSIVEDLYNNDNLLIYDCEGIAFELRTDEDTIKSILNDFDLFVKDGDSFGSISVQKRLEARDLKSKKARESARKRWDNKQTQSETNANALRTESDSNAIKERKGKEKKESKLKEKILTEVVTSDVPPNEVLYFDIALKFHAAFRQVIVNANGSTKTIDRARYKTWVDPIRLMMENDGITREQINVVGKYVIEDTFWRGNIQSTSKLREKFDKLIVQANEKRNSNNGQQQFSEEYKRELEERLSRIDTSKM